MSIRFIRRHKAFAVLNISGLTIGLFSCRFGLGIITLPILLSLVMYLIMIGYRLFRAICTNPADCLRTD